MSNHNIDLQDIIGSQEWDTKMLGFLFVNLSGLIDNYTTKSKSLRILSVRVIIREMGIGYLYQIMKILLYQGEGPFLVYRESSYNQKVGEGMTSSAFWVECLSSFILEPDISSFSGLHMMEFIPLSLSSTSFNYF